MAGSPVYETLREVAQLILPLNLTDPEAASFKAEACATYHDITRFAHEMSVRDMFDFGSRSGLASQASSLRALIVEMKSGGGSGA